MTEERREIIKEQKVIDPRFLIGISLVISILMVYWQVQHYEFVAYDDGIYVTLNRHVHSGLTWASLSWAFTSMDFEIWQPLIWLSWMLDYELYGLNAGGYHWTNILFHIANTLLLFLLLERMTGSVWRSGTVAALFALHPLHVESVAWVAERKDVLSTFFWMLTLCAYYHYVKRRCKSRYFLMLFVFILGLMSKPMLVTLPFVLLLLDYWPLGRCSADEASGSLCDQEKRSIYLCRVYGSTLIRLILEKTPLFFLAAGASILAYFTQKSYGALATTDTFPVVVRLANAIVAYGTYIIKTIWPWPLAIFYPHPSMESVGAIVLSSVLLITISILVWRWRCIHPYLFTGWFWYLVTLAPVIGIIQVGEQATADRYTYIPLIGIFLLASWGLPDLSKNRRGRNKVLIILGCAVLLVFMVLTWRQVQYWRNSSTLFGHALQVTSRNYVAHNNYGNVLLEQGRLDEALAHFREASALMPGNEKFHKNVGLVLFRQERYEEAIKAFTEALRINPKYGDGYYNRGNVYYSQRRLSEAADQYRRTIDLVPDHAEAHNNMGMILAQERRTEEAMAHCGKAIRSKPDFAEAWNNMGVYLANRGDLRGAIKHFEIALKLKPDYLGARSNRDRVLKQLN